MLLEEIEWDGEAFMKIENFRSQNIMTYLFSKTLKNRPDSLRGVEWWRYLSWLLPSDFDPEEFDICKLPKLNFMPLEPAELLKASISSFPWSCIFKIILLISFFFLEVNKSASFKF